MRRGHWVAIAIFLMASGCGSAARAQGWYYPPGYGGWGWGGWGARTVAGDVARGMGAFAAGAGVYNERTARAEAIEADTVMRWNEYMYEAQQARNRRYEAELARRQKDVNLAQAEIHRRLREAPNSYDIDNGDALNVALDELLSPKVYLRAVKGADVKIPASLVRDIPFQGGVAALTESFNDLASDAPPPALMAPAFDSDRTALRDIGRKARAECDERGKPSAATVARGREILKSTRARVESTYPAGSPERREAERYLKGLYGLSRMMDEPDLDAVLADIDRNKETTLAHLLAFMQAFNLRFGAATTDRQREAYRKLFPILDQLRDEASPTDPALARSAPLPDARKRPGEYFSGMDFPILERPPTGPRP